MPRTKQPPITAPVVVRKPQTVSERVIEIFDSLTYECQRHVRQYEEVLADYTQHIQKHGVADAGRWKYLGTVQKEYHSNLSKLLLESVLKRMKDAIDNKSLTTGDLLTAVKKEMKMAVKHLRDGLISKARHVSQCTCSITNLNHQAEGAAYAELFDTFNTWQGELDKIKEDAVHADSKQESASAV